MNTVQLIGLGKFLAELSHSINDIENSVAEVTAKIYKIDSEVDKLKKWIESVTKLSVGNNEDK